MKAWGFLGGSGVAASVVMNGELTQNLYPELSEAPAAKTRLALYGTPGLRVSYSGLSGPLRGLVEQDGRAWAIGGGQAYEVFADETVTARGTVVSDPNPATFAATAEYLVMTSGGRVYVLTLATNAFALVADADCPIDALMVKHLAGYFLLLTGSGVIIYSAVNDPTSWDASDLIIKTYTTDLVRAIEVHNQQLWLLGSNNIEVWVDTGDALTPFQPLPGVVIEQGLAASFSVAKMAGSLMFLGEHSSGAAIVFRTQGYTPVRVSTHAEEYALSQESTTATAVAWIYQQTGHQFYLLNLARLTRVYDLTTQLWHSRAYRNPATGLDETHLGQCHAYAFGAHLVGSRRDGVIYEMRMDLYADAGDPLIALRRSAWVASEQRPLRHKVLVIDQEVGVGLSTGQGSAPVGMLRFSDDGETWSHERTGSIGAIGNTHVRVQFRRLGRPLKQRMYEYAISDPVKRALMDGYLEVA